jgi:hypothetical protein
MSFAMYPSLPLVEGIFWGAAQLDGERLKHLL